MHNCLVHSIIQQKVLFISENVKPLANSTHKQTSKQIKKQIKPTLNLHFCSALIENKTKMDNVKLNITKFMS